MSTLPLTLAEADFQNTVIDLAHRRHWRVAHFRAARTAHGWQTPMQGEPGFPDLVLARDGVVLIRELKRQHGSLGPSQRAWLGALGELSGVWRPSDWFEIQEILQ